MSMTYFSIIYLILVLLVPNCRWGGVKLQILGKKTHQVHLTIIRERPKSTPPPPNFKKS